MIEFGIRLPDPPHRVIVGPGWKCEADVMAAMHYHNLREARDHGELVQRVGEGPWTPVRPVVVNGLPAPRIVGWAGAV